MQLFCAYMNNCVKIFTLTGFLSPNQQIASKLLQKYVAKFNN